MLNLKYNVNKKIVAKTKQGARLKAFSVLVVKNAKSMATRKKQMEPRLEVYGTVWFLLVNYCTNVIFLLIHYTQ